MFAINVVVALHHLQHGLPPVGQILQLMSLHFGLVGIFQVDAVVELNIEVDLTLPQVANTKSNHCTIARKGRVVLVLRIFSPRILMNWVMLHHMQIILRFLPLYGDLVTAVLLHAFVEALHLIHRQQVVKADGLGQLKQNQNDYYSGVTHELIINIVKAETLRKVRQSGFECGDGVGGKGHCKNGWGLILTHIQIDHLKSHHLIFQLPNLPNLISRVFISPIRGYRDASFVETSISQYKSSIRQTKQQSCQIPNSSKVVSIFTKSVGLERS